MEPKNLIYDNKLSMSADVCIPVEKIKTAIKEVIKVRRAADNTYAKIASLGTPAEILSKRGTDGMEEYKTTCAKLDNELTAVKTGAAKVVKSLYGDAIAEINDYVMPKGEDINSDFALLTNGLITTPEKLEMLVIRNNNNTFKIKADAYAKERDWNGFSFLSLEKPVIEYTEQIFNALYDACYAPMGVLANQYTATINEYARIADVYGIREVFDNSNGASINGIIDTTEYEVHTTLNS